MTTKLRPTSYDERRPATSAAPHLACTWVGVVGDDGGAYVDRVLPDACIDVIWDGRRVFVAGPDTGPVIVPPSPGSFRAGVRFRPGHAPAFLAPASALLDQRVDIAELWGGAVAARLEDALSECSPEAAASALEAHVATLDTADDDRWSDVVASLAREQDVDTIAGELGVTARTLHRRCVHAFGYGAKTLQRVLRFREFLALAESTPAAPLGRLAAEAGYADQSHLTRDSNELSGLAPRALLINRGVRSVQDADD